MEKQRRQDLGQKTMFFHPNIPKNMRDISKTGKRHNYAPPLAYV